MKPAGALGVDAQRGVGIVTPAKPNRVDAAYIDGIREGRAMLRKYGPEIAAEEIDNLNRTIKGFSATSAVGQMLRGERDFWKNQIKKGKQP